MAQDLWASSGYRLLMREGGGLRVTDAWLAHLLRREELVPPEEAGPREQALHARLLGAPRTSVRASDIAFLEDPDARRPGRPQQPRISRPFSRGGRS